MNESHFEGFLKHGPVVSHEERVPSTGAGPLWYFPRSLGRRRLSNVRIFLLLFIGILFLSRLEVIAQDEVLPGADIPLVSSPMDFRQCVKASLEGSPYLTTSSLDIDLKRLDEADALYSFIPSFSLRTSYYLNQPQNNTNRPYAIQFVTETYNPIENYFNLKARQFFTRIGILAHMQVISDFLQRLGTGFLELETLDRMASLQRDSMDLSEQAVIYARARLESGGGTSLDVRVAEQELELARIELSKIESARATILAGLANMIGPSAKDGLHPELNNSRDQVIDRFDPNGVTLEDARKNSFDLRIQALRRELQEKNITLAYTRFLPTFIWGVQTTDPFSANEERGLFFSVGFDLPLWDGLKRYHNISRQKTILRQYEAEGKTRDLDFDTRWSSAQRRLTDTTSAVKVSRSQQELTELKERQTAIGYNAGRLPLSTLLADRRALLDSRRNSLNQILEYDKAVLGIRNLSGDLIRNYVDTTIE